MTIGKPLHFFNGPFYISLKFSTRGTTTRQRKHFCIAPCYRSHLSNIDTNFHIPGNDKPTPLAYLGQPFHIRGLQREMIRQ